MVSKREQEVYEEVLRRDRWSVYIEWMLDVLEVPSHEGFLAWEVTDPWICIAPYIDPKALGTCSGEMTRDHVHEHTGGTKAKRAPTTMETVVILCSHHHLNGWATSHRPEIRRYIKEANERYKTVQPGRPR